MSEVQWNRGTINELLLTNDRAVERALIALYARQTSCEKDSKQTRETNGRGFSKYDAEIFSSFAQWVERGRTLTPRQLETCRKLGKNGHPRIGRYWKQLLEETAERK